MASSSSFAIGKNNLKVFPYFRERRTTYSLPHKRISYSDIRTRRPAVFAEPVSWMFLWTDGISHSIGSRLWADWADSGRTGGSRWAKYIPHTYGLQGIKFSRVFLAPYVGNQYRYAKVGCWYDRLTVRRSAYIYNPHDHITRAGCIFAGRYFTKLTIHGITGGFACQVERALLKLWESKIHDNRVGSAAGSVRRRLCI